MLFNSLYFLLFSLFVLLVYHAVLRSFAMRKLFLLAASWFFYATWSPQFLLVLIATTLIDFQLARLIYRARWRSAIPEGEAVENDADGKRRARALLVLSLVINLGLLAFFKYGRFFYQTAASLVVLPPTPGFLAVFVPLGISFYTFHSISYVIDTYRGVRPPTNHFGDFALYVAFFPQLIAGPITRWGFFGPQLASPREVSFTRFESAIFLIAVGYVKKVVCADSLGGFVDGVYGDIPRAGHLEVLLALYAYTFQIYFDFSGYTDIAMGVAGLLGFRLPENFRHPYLAENPSEFWRRWHISLSSWLRDYLYIPLGGSRRGNARTYFNLLVTMLLGGLWHGAAWTFVLWGGFHGLWLALHRLLAGRGPFATAFTELSIESRVASQEVPAVEVRAPLSPLWLRRLVTFHLVTVAWVLFRAGTVANVAAIFAGLFSSRPLSGPFPVGPLFLVLIGAASHGVALRFDLEALWRRIPRVVQGAVYGLVVVLVGLFSAQSGRFIYFQF